MAQQISKRHHYLPQFLLKGFTMDNGRLWVYDKQTQQFWKEPASPRQIFWRPNQNTFQIGELKTDFLESIYSRIDDDVAPFHSLIVKRPGPVTLTLEEAVQLIRFIAISYYRVPANDEFIADYVKGNDPRKLGFKLKDKTNPEEPVDDAMYRLIANEPAFIETYRISKALLEMLAYINNLVVDDWTVAAPKELNGFGVIGDNPVILRKKFSGHIILHDLIMPISKHHLVYRITGYKPVQLSPEHKVKVDLCQILQADRYVCGSNKGYMELLITQLSNIDEKLVQDRLKSELFADFTIKPSN